MELAPVFIYGLPALIVLATALVGSTRRLGFWLTLLLSLVITPVGGFVVALLSGPRRRKPKRRKRGERRPIPEPSSEPEPT